MAFGIPAMIKAVLATAVITSLGWIAAMSQWHDQLFPREAVPSAATDSGEAPAARSTGGRAPLPPQEPIPSMAAGALVIPVVGVRAADLRDTFSDARSEGRVHDAIDIMAPRGTPVIAAAAGMVEKLFLSRLGGTTVYIRSPDRRLIYYYAHLDSYAPGLAEGQQLARGAPIGQVGSTGNASPDGPHLHFAISATTPEAKWYQPSTALDPYPLLVGKGR